MIEKVFRVKDMHCSSCVMRIEGIEDDDPGILKIRASYHTQQVIIQFDERLTTEENIISAVEHLGYHLE